MYHTVIIGGGCLGAATAISLQKLNLIGKGEKVCLIEKAVLCAAESSDTPGLLGQLTQTQMLQ